MYARTLRRSYRSYCHCDSLPLSDLVCLCVLARRPRSLARREREREKSLQDTGRGNSCSGLGFKPEKC